MTDFADVGVRCEDHVGEVFPPRCVKCDALRASVARGAGEPASDGAPFEPWAPIGSFPDPWSKTAPDPWR